MQHYFVSSLNEQQIFLEEGDVFHVSKVMRMNVGSHIIAIYQEEMYEGEIISLNPFVIKNLGIFNEPSRELKVNTTLYFALAKGDKIDFVIQKATELGAKEIVLVKTSRCIVKMDDEDLLRKINARYYKIAKEAAEQSERRMIPKISGVVDINKLPAKYLANSNFVAYEEDAFKPIDFVVLKGHANIGILIGPEGGFSLSEIASLKNQGFKSISLGKRILRTETAAVVALTLINMVNENE